MEPPPLHKTRVILATTNKMCNSIHTVSNPTRFGAIAQNNQQHDIETFSVSGNSLQKYVSAVSILESMWNGFIRSARYRVNVKK